MIEFCQGQRDRLLAENRLACLQRTDRPGHMEVVRQRVVDGVDVRMRDQRFIIAHTDIAPDGGNSNAGISAPDMGDSMAGGTDGR